MSTIKIKASHPSQGDFVIIEEEDFDPAKHVRHGERPVKAVEPASERDEPEPEAKPQRGRPRKS